MSVTQRIIKNTVFLLSGQIFAKAVNLALILILTRFLGVSGFGIYSFSFAYTTLFVLFIHLGINNLLVREMAKNKDRGAEMISVTFPVLLIMSAFTVVLMNLIAAVSAWPQIERLVIAIFSIYIVLETMCRYFIAVIRAHEEMKYEALITIGERLAMLILTLIIWFSSKDLVHVVFGFTIIQLLRLLGVYRLIRYKYVKFKIEWDPNKILSILRESYPFALSSIFATISTRIDLVMIRLFHSAELSGVYNAARKLVESLLFVPENIYFAVFPVLSVYYLRDKQFFNITFQRVLIVLCIIGLPFSMTLFLYAENIIDLFFEPAFSAAAIPLRWLSFALVILFVKHSFAVSLNAIGKQHLFSIFTGISMVVNVGLNLILIPRYTMMGAALATVVSEFMTIVLAVLALRNSVSYDMAKINLLKLSIVATFTWIFMYFMRSQKLHFLITVILAACLYILLIYLFRIISKKDYAEVTAMLKRKILPATIKGDE